MKEYHENLTKGGLEFVISMHDPAINDEDFIDESEPHTITNVYKKLLQYKVDLKYYKNKENTKYQKRFKIE